MDTKDYFACHYEGYNIKLDYDPINRERTDGADNVLGIYTEEQPLMWELFKGEIQDTVSSLKGDIDFLDIGTGSGFWAIIFAKHIRVRGKIIAIDKSERAVEKANDNLKTNEVDIDLRLERYSINTVPYKSTKAICLTPPYHIYPLEVENHIPQHARGGAYGFDAFKEQLSIAKYHLIEGGKIFFNHMCLGNVEPEYVNFIMEIFDNKPSVKYINIFKPMSTYDFLNKVYEEQYKDFILEISKKYPRIFYTVGSICNDKKNIVYSQKLGISVLSERTWDNRIFLHKEIAKHYYLELGRDEILQKRNYASS